MINKQRSLVAIIVFVLFCIILLGGCARKPSASESAAIAAHQAIATIKTTLPDECKTDAVNAQLDSLDVRVDNVISQCAAEKAAISAEKVRWQWAFFWCVLIIAAYVGRRLSRCL